MEAERDHRRALRKIALTEAQDVGKVIREMRGQITGLRRWYRYYSSLAQHLEGRLIVHDDPAIVNFTRREPFGVMAVIPPFNSPVLLASWAIGPALAAGNTIVVKPPEVASASIVLFSRLFEKAGFPPGVVNVVTGLGAEAGDALVSHPEVRKVFFTGGPQTARTVAARAGQQLKPMVLELGGKSANIVFPDAPDLASVCNGVVAGIFAAAGQTCVAGSRLLCQEGIADELVDVVSRRAKAIVLGDPRQEETEMGPLSQLRILEGVEQRVGEALGESPTPRRWRASAPTRRLVLRAHGPGPRHQRHERCPPRAFRAGPLGDPLPRRTGSHRDCERQRIRSCRRGVDAGSWPSTSGGPGARCQHDMGQHVQGRVLSQPVRWPS